MGSESEACRLCAHPAALQESHIVPAFVFRWMKDTSATGFLRFGKEPNQRVQDGEKRPWLCANCEQLLSGWETRFAAEVFHPLNSDGGRRLRYGEWMLRFCVSLSWRVLLLFQEESGLANLTENQRDAVRIALSTWSDFMQGRQPHPGQFEQHFIPLDAVTGFSGKGMPSNIDRYALRVVDIDIAAAKHGAFVYCKIGKFIVIGFVDMDYPKQWVGTKIHVRDGFVGEGDFTLPQPFGDFLFARSNRSSEREDAISEKQQEKIVASMQGNMERTAKSGSFAALDADVRLFGDAAFKKPDRSR